MTSRNVRVVLASAFLLATSAAAGCGSDASSAETTVAATTTVPVAPETTELVTTTTAARSYTILLTNDDGIGAPGIDVMAAALKEIPNVEVVVVAPATNQSGTSDTVTEGELTFAPATTVSGIEGTAVTGTPADSVNVALDQLGVVPDLVVSGINSGQNLGPHAALSGTVGAGRVAARRGIPAIAVSAAPIVGATQDFETAAALVIEEISAHLEEYGADTNVDQTVVKIDVPLCADGTAFRGITDVPRAEAFPEGVDVVNLPIDCASTATDPADDVQAVMIGYASRSIVPADI